MSVVEVDRVEKHYGSVAALAGVSLTFADGEWLSGWIALRFLDDFRQSYTHFTGLYTGVSSPISKARGAYWAGRAAEEMGDMATAQNWYRAAASNLTTYYGQLAASRVGSRDVGPSQAPRDRRPDRTRA